MGGGDDRAPRPESPESAWAPPVSDPRPRRVDVAEEWRASKLSERELTIATIVAALAAIVVPFVGFILALLLLADRHIPHGIGVVVVALLSSPLFPLWS